MICSCQLAANVVDGGTTVSLPRAGLASLMEERARTGWAVVAGLDVKVWQAVWRTRVGGSHVAGSGSGGDGRGGWDLSRYCSYVWEVR